MQNTWKLGRNTLVVLVVSAEWLVCTAPCICAGGGFSKAQWKNPRALSLNKTLCWKKHQPLEFLFCLSARSWIRAWLLKHVMMHLKWVLHGYYIWVSRSRFCHGKVWFKDIETFVSLTVVKPKRFRTELIQLYLLISFICMAPNHKGSHFKILYILR